VNNFTWGLVNLIRRNRRLFVFVKSLRSIKKHGIKKTINDILINMKGHVIPLETCLYLSKHERKVQTQMLFSRKIKISVIVSLFNTNEQHLREMIDSILLQSYSDWELCLADGSDKKNNLKNICKEYTQNDKRIVYKKLDKKLGKAARLNKAIEMSNGEFITPLDQGDVLHPSAFYEVVRVICKEGADFVYSDEANFSNYNNIIS